MTETGPNRIAPLTPEREAEWERFVATSPHAGVGHLLGWRDAVARTYRHTPHYLLAEAGGRMVGALPLFLIRHAILGRTLVTAPFLSHGGLCADADDAAALLVDAARALRARCRAQYLEIKGTGRAGYGLVLKDKYCTYTLALDPDPAVVARACERQARWAVRKAERSGLTVERGNHLVGEVAAILTQHMRDLGTPFHGETFYRNILGRFGHQAQVFAVQFRDQVIGGGLTVSFNRILSWVYGGCLTAHRDRATMSLLAWEIIRYGCAEGMSHLDFGRSRWDSGTALFKQQWRARATPLYYEYDLAHGTSVPDMDPTNARFRLPIAAWKHLPVAVAKVVGPHLINGIP